MSSPPSPVVGGHTQTVSNESAVTVSSESVWTVPNEGAGETRGDGGGERQQGHTQNDIINVIRVMGNGKEME